MTKLLLPLLLAVPAFAVDTNTAAVDVARACRPELRSICKPPQPAGPLQCLKDKKSQASAACKAALDSAKGASLATGEARPGQGGCYAEYVRVCKGVKSKDLKPCLKAKKDQLSDLCRRAVEMSDSRGR